MQRELSAKLTEGLFSVDYRFLQSLRHGKPCHLPLHKGGLGLVPLKRVYVIIAWLAGQQKAHLCAASSIRAMPENAKPPAKLVDFYLYSSTSFVRAYIDN